MGRMVRLAKCQYLPAMPINQSCLAGRFLSILSLKCRSTTTQAVMHLRSLILNIILAAFSLSLVSCAAFTSGNILAIKAEIQDLDYHGCAKAYISELTPSGDIVQEIELPSEKTNGTHPCLIFASEVYDNRLTVSNDGYRAIMPCCNYVAETNSFLTSFAVIYGNGVIRTTAPFDANNGTIVKGYNAVLDGEDVWFSTYGAIFYTTLTSNTSTLVFSGDVFTLRSYEGNLYASHYQSEAAIAQIGEGLPTTISNSTEFLNLHRATNTDTINGFEFTEKYLTVGLYPNGLYVLNKTTHEPIYSNELTPEVAQLIVFEDQGKILAQMIHVETFPVIYEFTFNDTIGLSNGTLWLSGYNTSAYYYYGLIKAPQDSCQDNVKNFDETDVDCGGSLCSARCVGGKACSVASDCSSNFCYDSVCSEPPISPVTPPISTKSPISHTGPSAATSSGKALLVSFITAVILLGLITLV